MNVLFLTEEIQSFSQDSKWYGLLDYERVKTLLQLYDSRNVTQGGNGLKARLKRSCMMDTDGAGK